MWMLWHDELVAWCQKCVEIEPLNGCGNLHHLWLYILGDLGTVGGVPLVYREADLFWEHGL